MGVYLRSHTSQLTILALGPTCGFGVAQNATPARTDENAGAGVRLEPHDNQTHFKIGDPIVLDLVFTSRSPGYVVDTDTTPYFPLSNLVELAPTDGWMPSHSSFPRKGSESLGIGKSG
jgi:hypothetical protein